MDFHGSDACCWAGLVGVQRHLCTMKAMCQTTESHKKQLYAQQCRPLSVNISLQYNMLLLRMFAPWLLLAFLGQQVSLSSGAADKLPGKAQRRGGKSAATGQEKLSIEDKIQCKWSTKVLRDSVKLLVWCENPEARIKGGVTDLSCEYNGKPQRCPGYQSDPKGFWKQVARAFKRLRGKACRDPRALVKAGMCKRAPRDVHFKLDPASSRASAQAEPLTTQPPRSTSVGPTACTRRHRKTAEEYCSSSWASVCSFFLSMLQSEDC